MVCFQDINVMITTLNVELKEIISKFEQIPNSTDIITFEPGNPQEGVDVPAVQNQPQFLAIVCYRERI